MLNMDYWRGRPNPSRVNPCPFRYCKAPAGEQCRTRTGHPMRDEHKNRHSGFWFRVFNAAYVRPGQTYGPPLSPSDEGSKP